MPSLIELSAVFCFRGIWWSKLGNALTVEIPWVFFVSLNINKTNLKTRNRSNDLNRVLVDYNEAFAVSSRKYLL